MFNFYKKTKKSLLLIFYLLLVSSARQKSVVSDFSGILRVQTGEIASNFSGILRTGCASLPGYNIITDIYTLQYTEALEG
jgi:hypothetical protein